MFVPGMLASAVILFSFFMIDTHKHESVWDMVTGLAVLIALLLFSAAVIFALIRPRLVAAAKIDKPFVWLNHVHPDYVAACPELPRER